MKFKSKFSRKFENFEVGYLIYAERSKNSITKQPDFISNIDNKLSLVTEKINAERQLR